MMEEGLEAFVEAHPQKVIEQLLDYLKPSLLRDEVKGEILYHPEIVQDLR